MFGLMCCDMLSFQVENLELYPEKYVNKNLSANRRSNTRKHGRLCEFYRYYRDKKGFGDRDEKEGAGFSLVEISTFLTMTMTLT